MTPSNMSGALPIDDGVDVAPVQAGVVERLLRGLAHQPGDRDVVAGRDVAGLADPDDRGALGPISCSPPGRTPGSVAGTGPASAWATPATGLARR